MTIEEIECYRVSYDDDRGDVFFSDRGDALTAFDLESSRAPYGLFKDKIYRVGDCTFRCFGGVEEVKILDKIGKSE